MWKRKKIFFPQLYWIFAVYSPPPKKTLLRLCGDICEMSLLFLISLFNLTDVFQWCITNSNALCKELVNPSEVDSYNTSNTLTCFVLLAMKVQMTVFFSMALVGVYQASRTTIWPTTPSMSFRGISTHWESPKTGEEHIRVKRPLLSVEETEFDMFILYTFKTFFTWNTEMTL